jgi:HD-GYP domain-containing protein (c-di-GMP phosphodiesterase class II)
MSVLTRKSEVGTLSIVTDIFDALTTDQPNREALFCKKAFAILWKEVKRGWWDDYLIYLLEPVAESAPQLADATE